MYVCPSLQLGIGLQGRELGLRRGDAQDEIAIGLSDKVDSPVRRVEPHTLQARSNSTSEDLCTS